MSKGRKLKTQETAEAPASELFFWAQALTFALIVLVVINTFLIRISGVSGTSMVPTLQDHDQILLQIAGYHTPKKGEMVVVISKFFGGEPLVKRVIGTEGDVIDISQDGHVIVNGEVQEEPYIAEFIRESKRGSVAYPYTVSEGCVFVMGDNRNGSSDSREIGELPCDEIVGRAVFRVWPLTKIGVLA